MGFSERYRKTFPITWDQLHRDAKALAWRLIEQGKFQSIVAITRGGLGSCRHYRQRTQYTDD